VRALEAEALDRILEGLRADGIAVCDGFLTMREVQALAECAVLRRARGDFAEARIGTDRQLRRRADVRGDSICWLSHAEWPAESDVLHALEQLRRRLNEGAFLGLFELELHYAWYPPGAAYARHVDRPLSRDRRHVSLVLYLNAHWSPADGGVLRVYADDGGCREIEPLGGRLVLFLTEARAHEVLYTRSARLSLTGWYRGRE
jgi:SM-20-related protein